MVKKLTISDSGNSIDLGDIDKSIKKMVVYFHSHGSNRQEGRFLLNHASNLDMNLCLIDSRGSGESEAEYTTLGIKEYRDIHMLIKYLQNKFKINEIILYGRSMGAASLMKFVSEYKNGNFLIR